MGRGDMGFDGMYSLRAVDAWIAVINSNLNSTTRIGYKGSRLKFKGGVTEVVRAPQNALQGIQIPESALHTDQTSIDFSQGSIINSLDSAHVALQGNGFFVLAEITNLGVVANPSIGTARFYTRDGEFHTYTQNNNSYLVNDQGLAVMARNTGIAGDTGLVTVSDAGNFNPATGLNVGTATAGAINVGGIVRVAWLSTINLQGLKFSKYGSTIFEAGASGLSDTAATPDGIVAGLLPGTNLVNQSLETSNTTLSQTIPELSLASKMFTAVSKIISVHQTNLDTVINLIR